jgi:hypothetical protein
MARQKRYAQLDTGRCLGPLPLLASLVGPPLVVTSEPPGYLPPGGSAPSKDARLLEGVNQSFAARAPKVRALLDARGIDKWPTVELVGTGGEDRTRHE